MSDYFYFLHFKMEFINNLNWLIAPHFENRFLCSINMYVIEMPPGQYDDFLKYVCSVLFYPSIFHLYTSKVGEANNNLKFLRS